MRLNLFTGDPLQDVATMKCIVRNHRVWVSEELGYQQLDDVLEGLMTFAINVAASMANGGDIRDLAKTRTDKIDSDINACMLRTYNKDFAYLQGLFRMVLDMD